ncbi:MAG TPA: hypothetical protein VLI04_17355 [Nocardioidaceae bacterium]|nr:hypothetical protein [Nocardioidaceae bacterium]
MSSFPILEHPCRWLAKTPFLIAAGKQQWQASEEHATAQDADWQQRLDSYGGTAGDEAIEVAECTMAVTADRAMHLLVVAMPTADAASAELFDDHGRAGLGEQADLGVIENGGSGFMRVDRVYVHLALFYDGINGKPARAIVKRILGDIEPGLWPRDAGSG